MFTTCRQPLGLELAGAGQGRRKAVREELQAGGTGSVLQLAWGSCCPNRERGSVGQWLEAQTWESGCLDADLAPSGCGTLSRCRLLSKPQFAQRKSGGDDKPTTLDCGSQRECVCKLFLVLGVFPEMGPSWVLPQ